jgi:hypothetical protein
MSKIFDTKNCSTESQIMSNIFDTHHHHWALCSLLPHIGSVISTGGGAFAAVAERPPHFAFAFAVALAVAF